MLNAIVKCKASISQTADLTINDVHFSDVGFDEYPFPATTHNTSISPTSDACFLHSVLLSGLTADRGIIH